MVRPGWAGAAPGPKRGPTRVCPRARVDRQAGLKSVPWDGYLKYFRPKVRRSHAFLSALPHLTTCIAFLDWWAAGVSAPTSAALHQPTDAPLRPPARWRCVSSHWHLCFARLTTRTCALCPGRGPGKRVPTTASEGTTPSSATVIAEPLQALQESVETVLQQRANAPAAEAEPILGAAKAAALRRRTIPEPMKPQGSEE
jgi:hypothetical protein